MAALIRASSSFLAGYSSYTGIGDGGNALRGGAGAAGLVDEVGRAGLLFGTAIPPTPGMRPGKGAGRRVTDIGVCSVTV